MCIHIYRICRCLVSLRLQLKPLFSPARSLSVVGARSALLLASTKVSKVRGTCSASKVAVSYEEEDTSVI